MRATYASYAVELLDRFTVDEDAHRDIYDLLAAALGWFAREPADELLLPARFYELRLLSLTGFCRDTCSSRHSSTGVSRRPPQPRW